MFFKLFLLFTLVPIVELYLLIRIGARIGAGTTIAVILITGVVGAYLARMQGFSAVRNIKRALEEGRMPGNEILHGIMVLLGAVTLITPGFLTDFIGLTLLIPATRQIYLLQLKRWMEKKIRSGQWRMEIRR